MTHTSTEQPEALRLAYEIGANRIKVQPTEAERLRFEQWMAGHCWKVGGTWDGTTYRGAAEHGDYLDPQAMHTRQLFAAWRDCAALRDQLEASKAQRVPLSADEIKEPKNGEVWRVEWWNESLRMMLPSDKVLHRFNAYRNGTLQFTLKAHAHGITQEKQG